MAVMATEGYIRVIAGAGSGKTTALTSRFAFLVDAVGVDPSKILCVTFTNKAANQMKDRVRRILGEEVELPHIQTFHSFCNFFLRYEIENVGFRKKYKIMDEGDQKSLIKSVYEYLGIKPTGFMTVKDCLETIVSNKLKDVEDIDTYINYMKDHTVSEMWSEIPYLTDTEDKVAKGYLAEQKSENILDYADLINMTLYVLRHNPEVLARWQKKFEHIQIDEFQDVNDKELEIIALLSAKSGNLFVVGDPDQCLYTFRGANVRCIVEFDKRVSRLINIPVDSSTLYLNTNYRSTPEITKMANSLIRNNKIRLDKDLIPVKENGVISQHKLLFDERSEADYIAETIRECVKDGYKYNDIAVLYRTNFISRVIEKTLLGQSIPYMLVKGTAFYARKEIKNILAILSLVAYDDNISLLRLLSEFRLGIGKAKVSELQTYAQNNDCSLFHALIKLGSTTKFRKTGALALAEAILKLRSMLPDMTSGEYESSWLSQMLHTLRVLFNFEEDYATEPERLDNISEFAVSVQEFEEIHRKTPFTLVDYLEEVSLFSTVEDNEDDGSPADKVQLMTIHAAKGLEFPVVIVAGVNQGILPYQKALINDDIEEERRICYVAMTRAEDRLYLTSHRGMNFSGEPYRPSEFLYEIPASFFKSNMKDLGDDDENRQPNWLNATDPEIKVAYYQLNDEQIKNYEEAWRLLNHYSTYYDEQVFTKELNLKLLRFIRTLSTPAYKEWLSNITVDTYKDVFAGNFQISANKGALSAEDAVNLLLASDSPLKNW